MSMSSCLVSYIIPVFNGQEFLSQTLASIYSQKGSYEVLVVDDGSTDGSGMEAKKHSKAFADLGVPYTVVHQDNSGEAVAVNTGISLAIGKYICVVSADDILGSGHLQEIEKCDGNQLLMIPMVQTINEVGKVVSSPIEPQITEIKRRTLMDFECVPSVGTVVRRAEALATMRRPYSHISDLDFYVRLLGQHQGWNHVISLNKVVCSWRSHSQNMSKRHLNKKREDYLQFVEALEWATEFSSREKKSLKSSSLLRALLLSLEDGTFMPSLLVRAVRADPLNAFRLISSLPLSFVLATIGLKVQTREEGI